jgi:Patatin-like phospholipase
MAVVQGPQIAITPGASTIPIEQVPQHSAGPAIVLSGGGTKGDFEVGAVRCLYEQGILPNILCGTSVGSVNAPPRRRRHARKAMWAVWLAWKRSGWV